MAARAKPGKARKIRIDKHEKTGKGYGKGLARWERIKTDIITIRLPRGLMEKVRDIAQNDDSSISHVFRSAIEYYVRDVVESPESRLADQRRKISRDLLVDEEFLSAVAARLKSSEK